MRNLSLITILFSLAFVLYQFTENPHGSELKVGCEVCHSPDSWTLNKAIYSFDHSQTKLPLEGEHLELNCRLCHPSLVFADAGSECMDCHDDIHSNSVGLDCSRCHTPQSWLVSNVTEIHQMSRFPLLGSHAMADCADCHQSENFLIFDPLGIECFDCHQQTYAGTVSPNHTLEGYSIDCWECHNIYAYEWGASGFNHGFFPLTFGHDINDCAVCHKTESFSDNSPLCFSCHEADYNNATQPNHITSQFGTDCESCHSTNGWKPATFDHDEQFFPIYSGEHKGEWNSCNDCHTNQGNYSTFSCIDCHEHNKNEMDNEHDDENNYSYNSAACFDCHPDGRADDK